RNRSCAEQVQSALVPANRPRLRRDLVFRRSDHPQSAARAREGAPGMRNFAFYPLLQRRASSGDDGENGRPVRMAGEPEVGMVVRDIMTEVEAVATKLAIAMPIAGAEKVGEHKTSMLQDLEAGRPMELEAVVGAVVELGELFGIPMPHTRTVYACTKLL